MSFNSTLGLGTITINTSANIFPAERTGEVRVASGVLKESITVTQKGGQMADAGILTEEPEIVSNDATAFLSSFGMGYNLGNHFDSNNNGAICDWNNDGIEEWWDGCVPVENTYKTLYSKGFHSIRIPVTWSKHMGPAPDYTIDPAYLALVGMNVAWARDAGFRVIVNIHHDDSRGTDSAGNIIFQNWLDVKSASESASKKAEISDRFAKVWKQIATYFKNEDDYLMFECFNEINDGGWGWSQAFRANPTAQTDIVNEWVQLFVDTVRATGGNNSTRWLGVTGYCANPGFTMKYLKLPEDSAVGRIAVAVHDYDPSSYTIGSGDFPQWGHTASSEKDSKGNYKYRPYDDESTYIATVRELYNKYIVNNIPVYIGEAGCKNKEGAVPVAFKKYYLEYTWRAFTAYGMPLFLWDGSNGGTSGDSHGFMSHSTGEYLNDTNRSYVEAMYRAVYTPKSDDYSLKFVYNMAPVASN